MSGESFGSNSTLQAEHCDLYSWQFVEEEITCLHPGSGKLQLKEPDGDMSSQPNVLLQAEECRAQAEELFRGNCKKKKKKNTDREARVTSLVSMATYLLFSTVSSLNMESGRRQCIWLGRSMRHKDRQRTRLSS